MSSFPVPAGSLRGAGLTSEQLQRIELNRRRAQDRLSAKRKRKLLDSNYSSQQTLVMGSSVNKPMLPPQAKRCSAVHDPDNIPVQECMSGQSKTFPSSLSSSSSSSSSSLPSSSCSSAFYCKPKCTPLSNSISTQLQLAAGQNTSQQLLVRPIPQSVGQSTNSGLHCNQTSISNSGRLFEQSSARVNPETECQYLSLQKKIKANFVMLSKIRFKVDVPFDAKVIEIFKKIGTRFYGNY